MNEHPLVSVAVISYNSSKYILDALESIKSQTYSNIELIVSDDCSIDDSVEIVQKWISENKDRFFGTKVIKTPINLGVTGNCQNALNAANGEWFLPLAYDDMFTVTAAQSFIDFIKVHQDACAVLGQIVTFSNNIAVNRKTKFTLPNLFLNPTVTAKEQFYILVKVFAGSGPGMFYRTDVLKKIGFDHRFPLQEDHALFIKLTKAGYKIFYNPNLTIYKREVFNSIIHDRDINAIYGKNAVRQIIEYKGLYQTENMTLFWRLIFKISLEMRTKVITSGNNRRSLKCMFYYIVQRIFDPMRWELLRLTLIDRAYKYIYILSSFFFTDSEILGELI